MGFMCSLFSLCIDPFRLVLVLCVCVLGGGSGAPARRSNPSRDTGSKRMRNTEEAEGSNAPNAEPRPLPPKRRTPPRVWMRYRLLSSSLRGRSIRMETLVLTFEGMIYSGPSSRISSIWMSGQAKYPCGGEVDQLASHAQRGAPGILW